MPEGVILLKSFSDVKPFILHADEMVQRFSVQYFDEAKYWGEDLLPLILQAVNTALADARRLLLAISRNFLQSEMTLKEMMSMIDHYPKEQYLIKRSMLNAPAPLLGRFEQNSDLAWSPSEYKMLEQRVHLAELDTDRLFKRLLEYSEEGRGRYANEFDYDFGLYLSRELANRPDLSKRVIRQYLEVDYPEDYDGYDDIYACELAGLLRMEEYIPQLIKYLHSDADLLLEKAAVALTRIGTLDVIRAIQREFQSADWSFRLFAGGVLGTIKHPVAEQTMLQLIQSESDDSIRTILAANLCNILSVEGIPIIKQVIADGYDEMMLDLREPLYCSTVINGIVLPEGEAWHRELLENERAFRERVAAESVLSMSGTKSKPMIKVKVGRNEPCPCGSGKKYKKCCGFGA